MMDEPTYRTVDPVRQGDLVRIGEWDGVVEFLVTKGAAAWADYWVEHGEGVMLTGPAFGRLCTRFDDEDLVFIQRKRQ